MIYAFTGKTGSGKTFRMVKFAYRNWLKGVDIYSNTMLFFELKWYHKAMESVRKILMGKRYKKFKRGNITFFETITDIIDVQNGLILFDEAQVLLNARNWEALPDEFSYKLQQHRKHKLDLYCTTQSMGTIDINYRRLVQSWHHHKSIFELKKPRDNKVLFGLYSDEMKDIDMLYQKVDDLLVDSVSRRFFIIHIFKAKLYDTMYDIGFRRFKILWAMMRSKTMKLNTKLLIIPKKYKLKDALRQIYLLNSTLKPKTSIISKRNWRS